MEDFSRYLKLVNNCNQCDPLLSSTSLGKKLDEIPVHLVDLRNLIEFTQALNVEQLIPTANGLSRDYRGLAELMGFSSVEIENCFKRSYNPTKSLIDAYIDKNLSSRIESPHTMNDLLKLTEKIERFDVIDDLMPTLIRLAQESAQAKKQQLQYIEPKANSNLVTDLTRLTVDDTQSGSSHYDAFMSFAQDDAQFALELVDLLERSNKRVATANDLLPGQLENEALIRLIDMRCRKVIVILSPSFTRSKACEFQSQFASELGIRAGNPKIIPVLYEYCEESSLPSTIKYLAKIDMTDKATRKWQLDKLIRALDVANPNPQPVEHRWSQAQVQESSVESINSEPQPIIELSHSQNSENISITLNRASPSSGSSGARNWLKNMTRKMLEPSKTESRTNLLLSSDSGNLSKDNVDSSV